MMGFSIREHIIQAIVNTLDGVGKPSNLTVGRFERKAIEVEDLPYLCIFPGVEEVEKVGNHRFSPLVTRRLNVIIEIRADGEISDQAIDPILNWVTSALQSSNNLGGLANDINERTVEWVSEQGAENVFGRAQMTWEINYQTVTGNQERRS